MTILKAGGEEFTGNPCGNAIRNIYMVLDSADDRPQRVRELDLRRVKERMRTRILIDGRRVFEPEGVRGLGFVCRGLGREFS